MRDPRDNYGGSDRGPRDGRGPDRGDSDRSLRDSYGGRGGGEGGRDSYGRGDGGRGFEQDQPQPPKRVVPPTKPNDVEIICLMKNTRQWAEFIEGRLKNMGLRVDVLFPNPDIPIGKVLGNIAMRGVMFAICVAPENEIHRSLTVNVLQGEQQEHRNMPIDEAVSFIAKNFSKLIEKPAGAAVPERPDFGLPEDIKTILGFLTDNRPMSIMEYDKLIKYLVSKRESSLKTEYGSNIPAHLLVPPVGPNQDPHMKAKQEELQSKVIDILSKKNNILMSQAPAAPSINPALQQAIDSLVKSGPNLLNSIGKMGGAPVSSAPFPSSAPEVEGNLGGYFANLYSAGGGSAGHSYSAGGAGGGQSDYGSNRGYSGM